jgi:hypothetical protein
LANYTKAALTVSDTVELKNTPGNIGEFVALKQYSNSDATGGGTFRLSNTTYPTGRNVFSAPDGKQWIRITTPDVPDTVELKKLPPIYPDGYTVYLRKLSSANPYGGGTLVMSDSLYPEMGLFAFDHTKKGKQWVRQGLLEKKPIYLAEYGVVPNDSTFSLSNTKIINRVLKEIYTGPNSLTKVGEAVLPAGIIWVEPEFPGRPYCIKTNSGTILSGKGTSTQSNGTQLRLRANKVAAGDTCVVLVDSLAARILLKQPRLSGAWSHWMHVRDLSIDCNGQNQPDGAITGGVWIDYPGEASDVKNMQIGNYEGWGFRVTGDAAPPLSMKNISCFPSNRADTTGDYSVSQRKGFFIETGIHGYNLSGDAGRPLVYIRKGAVDIYGLKFEVGNIYSNGTYVALPVVIDSVNYIGSQVTIRGLTADAGQSDPNFNETAIILRGKSDQKVMCLFEISQATGWDNLFKYTINGVSDSVARGDNLIGDAEQRASIIRFGYTVVADFVQPIKPYPSNGFLYENHLDTLVQTLYYDTDQQFHVRSPRNTTVIEQWDGTDQAIFGANDIKFKKSIISEVQTNLESNTFIKQIPTPGNPASGYASIFLNQNGNDYFLLIKFANGDVDTLASSLAP